MSSKQPEEPQQNAGDKSADELTAVVEDLLNTLSNKFSGVSAEIFAKMDEMSRRLDTLEAALQASEDNSPNASSKAQ
ncbi:heat shock factor binding protein 1-domain-containing protein [Hypoxylon sp. FL0890]|nr:heat shock factor binding protein 1-domain-containing protein [Hypoxylon sp. FL0890]